MLPYQLQIVSLMAISLTQLGNVQHSIVTITLILKVSCYSIISIGWLLHHHFIYAKLEELYFNSKALKDAKVQN